MSKIVVALGGNALGDNAFEQKALVAQTAKSICDLVAQGHDVIVTHGNGPQVGMINTGLSYAAQNKIISAEMPLPECGAMSQGYIGFHLQNAVQNELRARQIKRHAITVITQVLVDGNDPAFSSPSKPIGAFYTAEGARQIAEENGYTMVEDSGRGYRRVVASPVPVDIVEKDEIIQLLESGSVVIAAGGGGIPVVMEEGTIRGVPAVIDKDLASEKLAELVHADMFVILTAVEKVAINFGKPDQRSIDRMNTSEAAGYIAEGHFARGSMLPKVQAAVAFADFGGTAVIASLENAGKAIDGSSGTVITNN